MNVLETIHICVASVKSNLQNGNVEDAIKDVGTLEDYIESLQDILELPILDKMKFDKE